MENNNINWVWVGVGFVVFILLAGLAGQADYEDAQLQEQAYCANVKEFKETNGQKGWPDYRELYDVMCIKESNKKND
jgi:hypothetical protein